LDARNGKLAIKGWREQLDLTPLEIVQRIRDWPLAAVIYTDIATDGTMADTTSQLAKATDVPVVASGGVGSLDHLRTLRSLPIQGAIVGRALYEGAFSIDEAIDVFEGDESHN